MTPLIFAKMNLATGTSRAGTPTGQRAKILYAKSRVTLHPTPYARDNKPGFLALLLREQNPRKALSRVKRPDSGHEGSASLMPVAGQSTSLAQCQASQIVLAWLSENIVKQRGETAKFIEMELREAEGLHANKEVACVGAADSLSLNAETSGECFPPLPGPYHQLTRLPNIDSVYIEMPPESFADRKASDPQDVFSQSLGSIHSVQVVPPTVSNWHGSLVITLVGGQLLPPLYFHDDESSSTLLGMHRASMSALPQSSHWPPPVSSAIREGSSSASAAASSTTIGSNSLTPIWGGDELVQHLRKYSFVHRSVHDHRVFLINPQSEDLEAHSTPIFSDDALDPPQRSNELKSANFAFPDDPFSPTYPLGRLASSSLDQPTEGGDLDSLSSWAKSTRMSLLSQFSHVTRSARDASRQLMEHPIVASAQQRYQRRLAEKVPTAAQSYANAGPLGPFRTDPLSSTVQGVEDMAEKAGVSEYDSARVYLAKWARSVAEEGERNKRLEEKGKNKATAASHGGTRFEKSGLGVFEVLEHPDASSRALRTFRPIKVAEWVSWAADGSDGGPTLPLAEVKELVFTRGLAAKSRSSAWPVLLGVEVWQASHQQRQQHKLQRRQAWLRLKSTWDVGAADVRPTDSIDDSEKCGQLYIMASHLMEREDIQEQRHRIRVDCLRTDRKMPYFSNRSYFGTEARTPSLVDTAFKVDDCDTGHSESGNPHMAVLAEILLTYSIYDVLFFSESALISQQSSICAEIPPLQLARMASGKSVRDSDLGGYVQGMSDLCSVLYVACEADASETFWCFVALMQRMVSPRRDSCGEGGQLTVETMQLLTLLLLYNRDRIFSLLSRG